MEPKLVILNDFNGYFESFTKNAILPHLTVELEEIQVEALPYMPFACQVFQLEGRKIKLRYYSALRNGFGMLGPRDVWEYINNLKFD